MKLNGEVTAVLLGVILTSTIGWGAYITKHQSDQALQTAVIEQKVNQLTQKIDELAAQIARLLR